MKFKFDCGDCGECLLLYHSVQYRRSGGNSTELLRRYVRQDGGTLSGSD